MPASAEDKGLIPGLEDSMCCWATKPTGPRACSTAKETTAMRSLHLETREKLASSNKDPAQS